MHWLLHREHPTLPLTSVLKNGVVEKNKSIWTFLHVLRASPRFIHRIQTTNVMEKSKWKSIKLNFECKNNGIFTRPDGSACSACACMWKCWLRERYVRFMCDGADTVIKNARIWKLLRSHAHRPIGESTSAALTQIQKFENSIANAWTRKGPMNGTDWDPSWDFS